LGPLSREAKLIIWQELVLSPRYLDHRGRASWKRLKNDHACVAAYPKTKLRNYYAQWKDGNSTSVEYHSLAYQQRLVQSGAAIVTTPFAPTSRHSGTSASAMSSLPNTMHHQTPSQHPAHFSGVRPGAVQMAQEAHQPTNGYACRQNWHPRSHFALTSGATIQQQQQQQYATQVPYVPQYTGYFAPATQGLVPGSFAPMLPPSAARYQQPSQDAHPAANYGISIHSTASTIQDPSSALPGSPALSNVDSLAALTPKAYGIPSASSLVAPSAASTHDSHIMGARAQVLCGAYGSGEGWAMPARHAQNHHVTSPQNTQAMGGVKRSRTVASMQHEQPPARPEFLQVAVKRVARGGVAQSGLPAHVVYKHTAQAAGKHIFPQALQSSRVGV